MLMMMKIAMKAMSSSSKITATAMQALDCYHQDCGDYASLDHQTMTRRRIDEGRAVALESSSRPS
jgi:hypothetical protein